MIAIIDSGGANIASVQFALERLGAQSVLTRDAAEIAAADRVLLPGVGAAPVAMKALRDAQLIEPISQLRQPVLGICLGMQLLFGRSFEGDTDFYDAAYWDLLTNMWRARTPVRKTDALKYMTGIKSAHTAGKYLDAALKKGLIREQDNPKDARSKLLTLSTDLRDRLDRFFDLVVSEMQKTCKQIDGMG